MSASTATLVLMASPPICFASVCGALGIQIRDDDAARSFSGEPLAQRSPDAVGSTGNDCDFVFEFHVSSRYRTTRTYWTYHRTYREPIGPILSYFFSSSFAIASR